MNNKIKFLIYAVIALAFYACMPKCEEYPSYYFSPAIEEYFHCYDKGSSWIYVNQNGTITDSLYFDCSVYCDLYGERKIPDDCSIIYTRYFHLNSRYLLEQKDRTCHYTVNPDYTSFELPFGNNEDFAAVHFISASYVDTLNIFFESKETEHVKVKLNKTLVSVSINGEQYDSVLNIKNKLWFAKKVGLIKYVSAYNSKDTFYLKNYYFKEENL